MTHVDLATNLATRYWMQAFGVTRLQLRQDVEAVGTEVVPVMSFLGVPERRGVG